MAVPLWWLTRDGDRTCLALYERHYSAYQYKDGRVRKDLTARLAAAEALLDSRAGKLLRKGKTFIVVAVDEPYFHDVFATIHNAERDKGTWTEADELWYQDAINEAAKAGGGE